MDQVDLIKFVVRTVLKEELSLKVEKRMVHADGQEYSHGGAELKMQLRLGEEEIGEPFYVSLETDSHSDYDSITHVFLDVE
jgi:hypothetical protein